jgi:hypothetical protein
VSAIDSELKAGQPGIAEMGWQAMRWWCSALIGLILALAGLFAYTRNLPAFLLPSEWWAGLGAGVLFVSSVGLLDQYAIVSLRSGRRSGRDQIRSRIATYYKRGQDLYMRLANDLTIAPDDARQLIADEWVNPVTDYLRGTVGDRKAEYFLSVARGEEPDDDAVTRFGYQRAVARERLMLRLERLRQIAGEV